MQKLTANEVLDLATVITAARNGSKVRWLDDREQLREGVARHLVQSPTNWGFFNGDDVRDAHLRVTSLGFDLTLPVTRIVELIGRGEFAVEK